MLKKIGISLMLANLLVSTTLMANKKENATKTTPKVVSLNAISNVTFFKNPNIEVKEVVDRGDLYQIVALGTTQQGKQPFEAFLTKDKKYVFLGTGFLDKTGERLSTPYEQKMIEEAKKQMEERQKAVAAQLLSVEKDASFVYGSGKKKYYLFTNPECPHCAELEKLLPSLKADATFYVYLLRFDKSTTGLNKCLYVQNHKAPMEALLSIVNGTVGDKFKEIKCAQPDGKEANCSNEQLSALSQKLDSQSAVAQQLGVRGTPTVFDAAGKQINWTALPGLTRAKN